MEFHIYPEDFLEDQNPNKRIGRDRHYWTQECLYQIQSNDQMSKRSFFDKYEVMIGVDYSCFCKWFKVESIEMKTREKRVYSNQFKKQLFDNYSMSSTTSLSSFLETDERYKSKQLSYETVRQWIRKFRRASAPGVMEEEVKKLHFNEICHTLSIEAINSMMSSKRGSDKLEVFYCPTKKIRGVRALVDIAVTKEPNDSDFLCVYGTTFPNVPGYDTGITAELT